MRNVIVRFFLIPPVNQNNSFDSNSRAQEVNQPIMNRLHLSSDGAAERHEAVDVKIDFNKKNQQQQRM